MVAEFGLNGIGHIPYTRDAYWEKCCDYLGYECITKKEVYDRIGYIPLPTATKMHKSRVTHRIVGGGNRSGKTYMAAMEIIPYLFWMGTRGWVVSANYDMAAEFERKIEMILTEHAGMTRARKRADLQPWEFYYSIKDHEFITGFKSTFRLKSADSPNSMHAVPLDWIIVDEAALLPYILYDTRLVPRLVDAGGWVLSVGTFEWLIGEWFEEYFDVGQTKNDLGIQSWFHPTSDNYHTYVSGGGETAEEVAKHYHKNWRDVLKMNPDTTWPLQKGQNVTLWNVDLAWLEKEKKRIPKEIFAARYEAQKSTNPYLVFPSWSIAGYVDRRKAAFDPGLPVYLAIDPGGTYAVGVVQFKNFANANKLTKGYALCVIDELYFQTTVTTDEVFKVAQQREWWPNVGRTAHDWWDVIQGSIDVMAKEQKRTWEYLGRGDSLIKQLHLRSQKVGVQIGNQTLQHYLDTKSLWVHPRCTYFCLEMNRYHYKPPAAAKVDVEDPRKNTNPKNAWNHLIKGIIYLVVAKYGFYRQSSRSAITTRKAFHTERKKARTGMNATGVSKAVVSRFRGR